MGNADTRTHIFISWLRLEFSVSPPAWYCIYLRRTLFIIGESLFVAFELLTKSPFFVCIIFITGELSSQNFWALPTRPPALVIFFGYAPALFLATLVGRSGDTPEYFVYDPICRINFQAFYY